MSQSRCGSNTSGWNQTSSQNGFSCSPQFLNIPGLPPYAPQKCNKTCSSPCCSAGYSAFGFGAQPPQMMMPNKNMPQMGRPPQGIRLRCPSCCRPVGSCCCGCCNCPSKSKTFY